MCHYDTKDTKKISIKKLVISNYSKTELFCDYL